MVYLSVDGEAKCRQQRQQQQYWQQRRAAGKVPNITRVVFASDH